MLANADQAHLLIIDVQEKLLPAVLNPQAVEARMIFLARMAQTVSVPITLSEQYPKGLGPTVGGLREAAGEHALVFEKLDFSCFQDPDLNAHFSASRDKGRAQIIVCGLEAHVCVMQTVLDLKDAGFDVLLVSDAVSCRGEENKAMAFARAQSAGIEIVTSEMVAFEWVKRAGSDAFKTLSNLIKNQS